MARNRRKAYNAEIDTVDGIPCASCGCRHSYVVRTERVGDVIRRTRRCRHCGRTYCTTEEA